MLREYFACVGFPLQWNMKWYIHGLHLLLISSHVLLTLISEVLVNFADVTDIYLHGVYETWYLCLQGLVRGF